MRACPDGLCSQAVRFNPEGNLSDDYQSRWQWNFRVKNADVYRTSRPMRWSRRVPLMTMFAEDGCRSAADRRIDLLGTRCRKATLERGLNTELTEHLGYEAGDADASSFENSRNGYSAKTVATEVGDVELRVPRDRNGTFTPDAGPQGPAAPGWPGRDDRLALRRRDDHPRYQHHLVSTLGTELSHETISKITEEVADEVIKWQHRELDALYPVIYLDAIMVKVRDGGHVRNKAAHIAVGVDMDGVKRAGDLDPADRGRQSSGRRCART